MMLIHLNLLAGILNLGVALGIYLSPVRMTTPATSCRNGALGQ